MTISQQYTTDISYIGNGVQTQFPIPFPFFTPAADVRAMLVTGSGDARAETPLVYNRDFTVSASPGVGGSLTTVAPPAVGVTLLIYLAVAILQELDLHDQGRIPAERLERSLDKLTMICQQQHASLERAVQVPIGAGDPQDLVTSLYAARNEAVASAAGAAQSQGEAAGSAQAAAEQAEGAAASALAAQEAAAQVVTDISGAMAAIQAEGDAQVARVDAEGEVQAGRASAEADRAEAAADEVLAVFPGPDPELVGKALALVPQAGGSFVWQEVGGGVPVGVEAWCSGITPPAGWLDESRYHGPLPRAAYPDLWAFALASGNLLDDASWQAQAQAQGACGAFSTGDGAATFRIPLLRRVFPRARDVDGGLDVGMWQRDTIRNITGTTFGGVGTLPTGAFKKSAGGVGFYDAMGTGPTAFVADILDVSLVVPTSDENRPVSIVRLPIIKAWDVAVFSPLE